MSADELRLVEDIVFEQILANQAVGVRESSIADARAAGAMALFGEKYGEVVRVVDVPGFSVELCGGTHAGRTGDIGFFRVLSEAGVAAGVRRIEALTGPGAFSWTRERDELLRSTAAALKTSPEQVMDAVERLSDERRRLDKELAVLKVELARARAGDLLSQAREINGVKVLAAEFFGDAKALREEADRLRDQLGSALVVLAARGEDAVQIIVTVSKDLAGKRFHAGNIVKQLAGLLGGGGGGRPDMAQAGGKNPDAVPEALAQVFVIAGA
jgi:alanyl-tRNA synthetase